MSENNTDSKTPDTDNTDSDVPVTVIRPGYYRNNSGTQLIELIRFMPFSLGSAVKYVYRHLDKDNAIVDLDKALFYLNDACVNGPIESWAKSETLNSLRDKVLDGTTPFVRSVVEIIVLASVIAETDNDRAIKLLQDAQSFIVEEKEELSKNA